MQTDRFPAVLKLVKPSPFAAFWSLATFDEIVAMYEGRAAWIEVEPIGSAPLVELRRDEFPAPLEGDTRQRFWVRVRRVR